MMIFVNFKTYKEGTGERAVKLAKICQEAAKESGVEIIVAVQAADIFRIADKVSLSVWTQHVDDITFGPNTGQTLPEAALAAGARGTILNHSENKLPVQVIGSIIARGKNLGLKTLVCAESIDEAKEIAEFKPDFLAYEPPELIGGNVSVSRAKPKVIKDIVAEIKEIPIIAGAGVRTQEDVAKAIKLGASGILVASGVVLAKNPKEILLDLGGGFR